MGSNNNNSSSTPRSVSYLVLAIAAVLAVHAVGSEPRLLLGIVAVGVPVALFAAGVAFMVGLWRLVWHGGRRQRSLALAERERGAHGGVGADADH